MNDRLLSMLGICKRAGQLIAGFDPVKKSVQCGRALLVLTASDLSDRTKKEIAYLTRETEIPCLETARTLDEFEFALGRRAGVYCVEQEGFAKKLAALVQEEAARHPVCENEEEPNL